MIPEKHLHKYLQAGFEEYLPDDMGSGKADTLELVEDFITYRKYLEEIDPNFDHEAVEVIDVVPVPESNGESDDEDFEMPLKEEKSRYRPFSVRSSDSDDEDIDIPLKNDKSYKPFTDGNDSVYSGGTSTGDDHSFCSNSTFDFDLDDFIE